MRRLFIGFLAIILFIFLLVVLLGHGGKTPVPATHPKSLPDYANTSATVSMTTDGVENGDDLHRQIRITIARDSRQLDIIQGYSGQIISKHTYYNTEAAFAVFLRSINYSGFTAANKSGSPADYRGLCPLGYRYIFDLNSGGKDISSHWASDCGTNVGTSGGQIGTLQSLFQDQIPGYQTLTENVSLNMASLSQ